VGETRPAAWRATREGGVCGAKGDCGPRRADDAGACAAAAPWPLLQAQAARAQRRRAQRTRASRAASLAQPTLTPPPSRLSSSSSPSAPEPAAAAIAGLSALCACVLRALTAVFAAQPRPRRRCQMPAAQAAAARAGAAPASRDLSCQTERSEQRQEATARADLPPRAAARRPLPLRCGARGQQRVCDQTRAPRAPACCRCCCERNALAAAWRRRCSSPWCCSGARGAFSGDAMPPQLTLTLRPHARRTPRGARRRERQRISLAPHAGEPRASCRTRRRSRRLISLFGHRERGNTPSWAACEMGS
jgi:hypothetical protein